MASLAFPSLAKKATLSDGTTYGWVSVPSSRDKANANANANAKDNVTLLFLHGFPSSSYDWRHQITFFQKEGYGVIVPDLLGYGDTDKPSDVGAYRMKKTCGHIVEILDLEGVERVVGVAHDWGVGLASRLANYHRDRLYGIVTIGVSYIEPGFVWDIDAICNESKSLIGYETHGYWKWHDTEQAATDYNEHPASAFNLLYPHDASLWKSSFCPTGKAADFVHADTTTPLPVWYPLPECTTRDRIFAASGYAGPLCWYQAAMRGVDARDEEEIVNSKEGRVCRVPIYLWRRKGTMFVGRLCRVSWRGGWWRI